MTPEIGTWRASALDDQDLEELVWGAELITRDDEDEEPPYEDDEE